LSAVIVVLLIRPWGDGAQGPPETAPGLVPQQEATAIAAAVDPTAPPVIAPDSLLITCGSPSGWRAATLQAWPGRTEPIRSWIAVEPVAASGPLDPGIPFVPVAMGIVTGVGYCAPLGEARPPVIARAAVWAITNGGAIPLSIVPLEPVAANALGGLWLPPPDLEGSVGGDPGVGPASDGAAGRWPPGRYALEVAVPGGTYAQWIGVEIKDLSLLAASPASAPSPGTGTPSPSDGATAVP
jgi:hypothetical protein